MLRVSHFTNCFRFGTYSTNGINYVGFEDDIYKVLTGRNERHVITDQQQELIEIMRGSEIESIRLEASLCFMVWETTLADFYEVVKKPSATFGQARQAMVCFLLNFKFQ